MGVARPGGISCLRSHLPARVMNVGKTRDKGQRKIRLDRLLLSSRPRVNVVRKLGGLGDVIMTTPMLKELKRLMPHCHLTYTTDLAYMGGSLGEVIKHNPCVDELIDNKDFKESDYDYWVDVTATGLKREMPGTVPPNRIDMFAEEAGITVEFDPRPDYVVFEHEQEWAQEFISEYFNGQKREDLKFIIIQGRANDARRTWPLENVQELAEKLAAHENHRVFIMDWGKTAEEWKEGKNLWVLKNWPNVVNLAAFMEASDLVVCPDSAFLHLAGALEKRTVAIFGPIPPQTRVNHYPNATAVYKELPCSFCFYQPSCMRTSNKLKCLTSIASEEVYQACLKKMTEDIKIQSIQYGENLTSANQDPIILVRRNTRGLGDILMAVPGIEALKKKHPKKEIHVAVDKSLIPALENNPHIDKVIDISTPINAKRYFAIIDISNPCARYEAIRSRNGLKVQKSRVEIFAEALVSRGYLETLSPKIYLTDKEKEEAKNFIQQFKCYDPNKPILNINTISAEQYRDWPKENIEKLVPQLFKDYNVLTTNKMDYFHENIIEASSLSLRRYFGIISQCDLVVSVDTSTVHIAEALGVKSIALFGPVDYKARTKGYKHTTSIVANYDCIPCWRSGVTKCVKNGKVNEYSDCMKAITVEQVLKAITDVTS